jgi:hypothetical protein
MMKLNLRSQQPPPRRKLVSGVFSLAVLFLATGTAHAEDTRKWIWRCGLVHAPGQEQLDEHERCCKRWPNVPNCNGDYAKAMSVPTVREIAF